VAIVGREEAASVVGRDEPLDQLGRFVRAIAERPGGVVVGGEAGIGKSTLWQAVVDAARSRGYEVLTSQPAESESALAYSGLSDLLCSVEEATFDELPAPQGHALRVALLLEEPAGPPPEPRAIYAGFERVLRSRAQVAPVLVAVDDWQWLDRGSAHAITYAWRRLQEDRVGIATTARLVAGGVLHDLPWASTITLGPLSAAALYRMIEQRLGVRLSRSEVLRVHRLSSGNPFYALELARVLVSAGMSLDADAWPVPVDLREMIVERIDGLPPASRSALLEAAAGGGPGISDLDPETLRAAQLAGIVAHGRFAHPLFASAIYDSATPEERRAAHGRLATSAEDPEERARHRALACDGPDEDVAGMLDAASRRARDRGAPDIAAELQERAIELTPPDLAADADRRRLAAAKHRFHAGDLDRARALLQGLASSEALRLLGEICHRQGDLSQAIRYYEQAIEAADSDPSLLTPAEIGMCFALIRSFGDFRAARAAARRALEAAEQLGDDGLLGTALVFESLSDLLMGAGVDEASLERALELEDQERSVPIELRPSTIAAVVLIHIDKFERAREVMTSLCDRLTSRGEESDLPYVLALRARVECLAGNPALAADLADDGLELARQAGSESLAATCLASRVLVDAYSGRVEEARAGARDATELSARSGWRLAAFETSSALVFLDLSTGDDEAAVARLEPSLELVEEHGLVDPCRWLFLPDAIEGLIRRGNLERAERLTSMLETRGRELDRPSAIIAAARCRALLHAERGELAAGIAAIDRGLLEEPRLELPLEIARCLIVRGQLQRRSKRKRAARESLERADALCEQAASALWRERARSELARLGGVDQGNGLTATETRVAELAASGLTNREIAASAFISPKTVEANLSRVYRKLGIRSRAELGVRLSREPVGP
jgi:DNA-binding CsgD family transcriptional regulator